MAADYQNPKVVTTPHKAKVVLNSKTVWKSGGVRSNANLSSTLSWSDYVTKGPDVPNWKVKLSIGQPVITPLYGLIVYRKVQSLGYEFITTKPPNTYDHFNTGGNRAATVTFPPVSIDSTASKQAASAFWNDVEKQRTTWKGGAAVAEFAETVRFAAAPVKGMYKESLDFVGKLGKLKKVYRSSPKTYAQAIGDLWLAYSLALNPLLKDVSDANGALAKFGQELSPWDHTPVFGSGTRFQTVTNTPNGIVPGCFASTFQRTVVDKYSVRYKARLETRPPAAQILDHFGINLGDIIPSVWEAIPFSFVVDYFANVQEMLTSLKYCRAGLSGQHITYRNSRSELLGNWTYTPNAASLSGICYGGQVNTYSHVVRRAPTLVPYPSWSFSIPGAESAKWANVGFLAASFLRSSPYGKLAKAVGV